MARLLLLLMTLAGSVLVFTAKSSGLLGLGLLLGIVGFFGLVLAMAAARVSASARPEASMASVEEISALRKRTPSTRQRVSPARTPVHGPVDPAG
jgi:hypothetical protein